MSLETLREIVVEKLDRKTARKAGAAAGYGSMKEAKATAKYDKSLAKAGYKYKNIWNEQA